MASIRRIKRDIDFLANEVISDCYMALYFNDDAKREQIVAVRSSSAMSCSCVRITRRTKRTEASCGSITLRCAAR